MTRLLVAIVLLVLGAAPAGAAPSARTAGPCNGTGVTVVVDYHGLGGGIDQRCDAGGGGRTADTVFRDVGVSLTYVQRQPGFVCQVQSKPGDASCVNTPPANAYWGLYWSDGKGGGWTYATTGVGGLEVPDGGSVAFAWQGSSASDPPGVAPQRASAPAPKATKKPTPRASPKPTPTSTRASTPRSTSTSTSGPTSGPISGPTSGPAATTSTTASDAVTPTPSRSTDTSSATPSATPLVTATTTSTPSSSAAGAKSTDATAASTSGGGLPWWLPVGLVVLLAAGGLGAVAWRRRGA